MIRSSIVLLALAAVMLVSPQADVEPRAGALQPIDAYTLKGPRHLVRDHPAVNDDGTVNVVVEIPAGTVAKWEVDKDDGALRWEFKKGKPRVVKYLGYPGNYGMVPRTLQDAAVGGDGDPLDVIVLGGAAERGAILRARLIGILHLRDGGETDDKLLAVVEGDPLAEARDLGDLDRLFPGVTTIVETWFVHYKGPGKIESGGFGNRATANRALRAAMEAYERS